MVVRISSVESVPQCQYAYLARSCRFDQQKQILDRCLKRVVEISPRNNELEGAQVA